MCIAYNRQIPLVVIMQYFPEIAQSGKYSIMATRWS